MHIESMYCLNVLTGKVYKALSYICYLTISLTAFICFVLCYPLCYRYALLDPYCTSLAEVHNISPDCMLVEQVCFSKIEPHFIINDFLSILLIVVMFLFQSTNFDF